MATTRSGWLARTWHTYVTEVVRDTNAASLEAIGTSSRRASDVTVGTILLVAAVCLIGIDYLGQTFEPEWFQSTLRLVGLDGGRRPSGHLDPR